MACVCVCPSESHTSAEKHLRRRGLCPFSRKPNDAALGREEGFDANKQTQRTSAGLATGNKENANRCFESALAMVTSWCTVLSCAEVDSVETKGVKGVSCYYSRYTQSGALIS